MQALSNTDKENSITSSFYKHLPGNIICFSHLRWDFVFQRPQHLMTRLSKQFNIFFIEEPVLDTDGDAYYVYHQRDDLQVVVPHLPKATHAKDVTRQLKALLDDFMSGKSFNNYTFWYYTPMAISPRSASRFFYTIN